MRTYTPVLVSTLACAFLAQMISARAELTLARKGQSQYRIVLATNAPLSERYAAQELQAYIEKMSGARLPIITDAERASSREILLGDNAHLSALGPHIDFNKLGTDGFLLRTTRNRLIIAGGKPRGTLYGVYELLEQHFGVRWFTPDLEVVPHKTRVSLVALNKTKIPALEYREVFWSEMMHNPDFAARHRVNGPNCNLAGKHGGAAVVYFPFVHSLDNLIPQELYQEHPEYFPLIKGERVKGYVQRCLSNPDVLKLAIDRVRQWIKEHPDATIISVSQNDVGKWCQCEQCKALDDAEGSTSASLIRFVNSVAEAIEADYPNIRIDTLAYQYTRKPPRTLRPRRNVIIRLCSIECCFAHSLADCESTPNSRFRDDIVAWQPVAPKLYVWDYTTDFGNYQQPFPNFDVLQPNVKFFVQHGVTGLFEQGNYSSGGCGEMEPLRAYLLAELLWNPKTDIQKHTTEFLNAYYGKAAPQIRSYLELEHAQVRQGKAHAHIFDRPKVAYLNEEFLTGANQILEQAEQQAENDTIRFRVQTARLPIWYVQLATDRVAGESRAELRKKFLETARKAGGSNISEQKTLDAWASSMEKK